MFILSTLITKIDGFKNIIFKKYIGYGCFCEPYFLLNIKGEPGNYNMTNKNEEIQEKKKRDAFKNPATHHPTISI